jgi:hypothetical protein
MEFAQCGFVHLSRGQLGGLSSVLLRGPSRERDTTSFVILGMGMTRSLTSNGYVKYGNIQLTSFLTWAQTMEEQFVALDTVLEIAELLRSNHTRRRF